MCFLTVNRRLKMNVCNTDNINKLSSCRRLIRLLSLCELIKVKDVRGWQFLTIEAAET